MAYAANWVTKVLTIPVSDLILISGTRYRLSMDAFLAEVKRLEWEFADGLWAAPILDHTNAKLDFAGANYVAFDEIINGWTVTFGAGPTRVDVTDTNNNVVDVLNVTGISIVPSNSAGLVNLNEIRATSYIGEGGKGIAVAPVSGTNSIAYPIGSEEEPCKTEANMLGLYNKYGYSKIYPHEPITLTGDYSDGRLFIATKQTININCDAAANVANCVFRQCYLTGELSTNNIVERSIIGNVTNGNQYFDTCAFVGTTVFSADTKVENCSIGTGVPSREAVFDFNFLPIELIVGNWSSGRIRVKNMVTGSVFGASGGGGRILVDVSCTGGTVVVGGALAFDKTNTENLDLFKDSTSAFAVWTKNAALAFGKWFGLK